MCVESGKKEWRKGKGQDQVLFLSLPLVGGLVGWFFGMKNEAFPEKRALMAMKMTTVPVDSKESKTRNEERKKSFMLHTA